MQYPSTVIHYLNSQQRDVRLGEPRHIALHNLLVFYPSATFICNCVLVSARVKNRLNKSCITSYKIHTNALLPLSEQIFFKRKKTIDMKFPKSVIQQWLDL